MSALCYATTPPKGVHLTLDGRRTLCGKRVLDVPTFPRTIMQLSCEKCAEASRP